MRYQRLHNWVFSFSCATWLASGCASQCGGEPRAEQEAALSIDRFAWSAEVEQFEALTPDEAEGIFSAELAKVRVPKGLSLAAKARLKAQLAVTEGEGTLAVTAETQLGQPIVALELGIAANRVTKNPADARELVSLAAKDLAEAFGEAFALAVSPPLAWSRALSAPEADQQIFAARLLGARKERSAIAALAKNLSDPRPLVADAAATALANIGDEAAVPLLIESARSQGIRAEVRAIEALARIGGKEAMAYLEMTAQGHESAEIRTLTRELMQQRRSKSL